MRSVRAREANPLVLEALTATPRNALKPFRSVRINGKLARGFASDSQEADNIYQCLQQVSIIDDKHHLTITVIKQHRFRLFSLSRCETAGRTWLRAKQTCAAIRAVNSIHCGTFANHEALTFATTRFIAKTRNAFPPFILFVAIELGVGAEQCAAFVNFG
jgi:hypothetical protein